MTDVAKFLTGYYDTFSTLDIESIAPFFNEPCVFISSLGVTDAPTHHAVRDVFRAIAEGLRAKGYSRSELANLNVKSMSDTTSLASGLAIRYRLDGSELERVGVTYIVQKSDKGWRIVVTVIHDPDRS